MKNIIFIIFIFCIIGCNTKSYPVTGTILEIRSEENQFLIHHDEIPGFMIAMTMPFTLKDSCDINNYSVGDSVHFYLRMNKNKAISSDFTLLGKGTIPKTDEFWKDEYTPLNIGDIYNNVSFLDLDSNVVSLAESDGKFRLISFIFTRCPMPSMCPATIVKNQYLANIFSHNINIEFLIISFDHNFDLPSILKHHYKSISLTNQNMKFYSSFGHVNDIYTIAGQSNVSF